MKCAECRRSITRADLRILKEEHDDEGRLVAVRHYRCWKILHDSDRRHIAKDVTGVEAPSAYDMAAQHRNADDVLRERQEQLAADHEIEPRQRDESDWRDQHTAEL